MTMHETNTVVAGKGVLSKTFTEFARMRSTTVPAFVLATNSDHALIALDVRNQSDVPASFKMQGSVADPINNESTIRIPASAGGGGGSDQVTLVLSGNLVDESTFGFWSPSAATSLTGAQISAQDAPVGAAAIFEVYVNGVASGVTATLADGATTADVTFGSPISLAAGDDVTLKVKQIGSSSSGAFVTVILTMGGGAGGKSPDVVEWTNVTGAFNASFEDIASTAVTIAPGGGLAIAFPTRHRFVRLLPTTANDAIIRVNGSSSSAVAVVSTDPQL